MVSNKNPMLGTPSSRIFSFLLDFARRILINSLFTLHSHNPFIFLISYVDDIVIIGNNLQTINNIKSALSNRFSLKDLGPLHFFLGIKVLPQSAGLFLSQTKCIMDILQEFSM